MSTPSYLAFLTNTIVLMLIPGPSVMLVIRVSLAHGFSAGIANVVGASGAVAVQMMLFGLGLTPAAFAAQWLGVIRWAGVGYLLYRGVDQWRRAGGAPTQIEGASLRGYARRTFWHGFAVSGLNPKSLMFRAAILPQFLDPRRPRPPGVSSS
jgi:threonine/homoserine/homoserine lactone efflux protein